MEVILYVRMVLTAFSAFLMGFVLFVAWSYMRVYARSARDWRRLLPFHVWTIASSYLLLLGYVTLDMVLRMHKDDPVTWRLPVLFVADVLGVTAMIIIDKLRRVRGNPVRAEDP